MEKASLASIKFEFAINLKTARSTTPNPDQKTVRPLRPRARSSRVREVGQTGH